MKKRQKPNRDLMADLRHIKGKYLTQLANTAQCDRSYAWLVLKGKRNANSLLAKKLVAAAKEMNARLESALHLKAVKDLATIDAD
jgi:hypothetical protein